MHAPPGCQVVSLDLTRLGGKSALPTSGRRCWSVARRCRWWAACTARLTNPPDEVCLAPVWGCLVTLGCTPPTPPTPSPKNETRPQWRPQALTPAYPLIPSPFHHPPVPLRSAAPAPAGSTISTTVANLTSQPLPAQFPPTGAVPAPSPELEVVPVPPAVEVPGALLKALPLPPAAAAAPAAEAPAAEALAPVPVLPPSLAPVAEAPAAEALALPSPPAPELAAPPLAEAPATEVAAAPELIPPPTLELLALAAEVAAATELIPPPTLELLAPAAEVAAAPERTPLPTPGLLAPAPEAAPALGLPAALLSDAPVAKAVVPGGANPFAVAVGGPAVVPIPAAEALNLAAG